MLTLTLLDINDDYINADVKQLRDNLNEVRMKRAMGLSNRLSL